LPRISVWDKIKVAIGPEKLAAMPFDVVRQIVSKKLVEWGLGLLS
jgi:hypothetical protein